jgi:hypothetical protein
MIRIQFDPVAAALRTYNQERAFRLGRLQGRYPQVRPMAAIICQLSRLKTDPRPHPLSFRCFVDAVRWA